MDAVWSLVGDPNRYPEWAGFALEVTGLPEIAEGSEYEQTSTNPVGTGSSTTIFRIDELEEMREIKLRCTQSGWYSHWLLTEAQGGTFANIEFGIDPTRLHYRLLFAAVGRRHFTDVASRSIDGLRDALEGATTSEPAR